MLLMMRVVEGFCAVLALFALVATLQSRHWQFGVAAVGFIALGVVVEALLREWRTTDFIDRWTPMTAVWGGAGITLIVGVALVLRTLAR